MCSVEECLAVKMARAVAYCDHGFRLNLQFLLISYVHILLPIYWEAHSTTIHKIYCTRCGLLDKVVSDNGP